MDCQEAQESILESLVEPLIGGLDRPVRTPQTVAKATRISSAKRSEAARSAPTSGP